MEIFCDICPNVPIKCTKIIGTKQSGKSYRQRWFKCPVCNSEKKINGSGYNSEVEVPHIIEHQLEKQK